MFCSKWSVNASPCMCIAFYLGALPDYLQNLVLLLVILKFATCAVRLALNILMSVSYNTFC